MAAVGESFRRTTSITVCDRVARPTQLRQSTIRPRSNVSWTFWFAIPMVGETRGMRRVVGGLNLVFYRDEQLLRTFGITSLGDEQAMLWTVVDLPTA
jgi:hypothetical protein